MQFRLLLCCLRSQVCVILGLVLAAKMGKKRPLVKFNMLKFLHYIEKATQNAKLVQSVISAK